MSIRAAADSWQSLRHGGRNTTDGEVPSISSEVTADAGPVRFALGRGGEGRLLVPVSASERLPAISETPTLRIDDSTFSIDGAGWRFIDLTCMARELDGVFAEVADEIVRRIDNGDGAIRACTTTLGEFRMLLVPRIDVGSTERIIGLIGELLLLDELLDLDADAVEFWRGPLGERHDFRGGSLAAEVKTTSRVGNQTLTVTSIDQLLEPAHGELTLVRYTLEETAGGNIGIGDLFTRVAKKSGNPLRVRDLLTRLECTDPLSESWNARRYQLEKTRAYRVDGSFPRIISSSLLSRGLPAGVSAVRYDVDLAAADTSLLSDEQRRDYLKRMIACR